MYAQHAPNSSFNVTLTHSLAVLSPYSRALQPPGYLSCAGPSKGDTVLLLSADFERCSLRPGTVFSRGPVLEALKLPTIFPGPTNQN